MDQDKQSFYLDIITVLMSMEVNESMNGQAFSEGIWEPLFPQHLALL